MKHISDSGLLKFVMVLPCLVLFILFILFFYRAIFYKGMQKMQFFILFVSVASAVFLLVDPVVRFTDLMPVRFIAVPDSIILQRLLTASLLTGYILVSVFVGKDKSMRIAMYTWLVILLFNTVDITREGYLYLTWVKPVVNEHPATVKEMILEHVRHPRRETFLYGMIGPFVWIIVSVVCLVKIRKEKARLSLALTGKEGVKPL